MEKANTTLPKIIWFLWLQGFDEAPFLVKKCYESWKKHNPGWDIIFLDESNINEHFDIKNIIGENSQYMSKQAQSDIVRINLLNKYGGVWVDSTCFCCKPLEKWLYDYMSTGFFAFNDPGSDRPISSWFLSSSLDSPLTSKYCEAVNLYWSRNYFSNQNKNTHKFVSATFEKWLRRSSYKSRRFWFFYRIIKYLKIYPYFWFHYLFAFIIKTDKSCKEIWESTKKYSAVIPHKIQTYGIFEALPEHVKHSIDSQEDPVYKLMWKYNPNDYVKGCTLYYLLER